MKIVSQSIFLPLFSLSLSPSLTLTLFTLTRFAGHPRLSIDLKEFYAIKSISSHYSWMSRLMMSTSMTINDRHKKSLLIT